MNLFTHEIIHFLPIISITYFVGIKNKNFRIPFIASFIGSILIDLDHLVDYFFAYGFNFKLTLFLEGEQFLKNQKMFVILHSWELIVIVIFIIIFLKKIRSKYTYVIFLFSLFLSLFFHIFLDVLINNIPASSYFFYTRYRNSFNLKLLEKKNL